MTDIEKAIEYLEEGVIESESHIEESFLALQKMLREQVGHFNSAIQALQEKAEREKLQENCACMTNSKACCTCVSMRCRYCVKQSNYTRGSFCSACGRKLNNAPTDEY